MDKRTIAGILALGAAAGGTVFAARQRLFAQVMDLPPASNAVSVNRAVPIMMADGVVLVGDHFRPKTDAPLPTILIRTPYSRNGIAAILMGFVPQRFAERGYNVFVQDVRGRGESGGEFEPYVHEADDGDATINWIARQPWSDGRVGMWGPSYLGFVQWAVAGKRNPHLKAFFPIVTRSQLAQLPGESFELDVILRWLLQLDALENDAYSLWERLARLAWPAQQDAVLAPAFSHLPVSESVEVALAQVPAFFDKWVAVANDSESTYWQQVDYREDVVAAPPTHFIGGWYDIFVDEMLDDYVRQVAQGQQPFLTVGPWQHAGIESQVFTMNEAVSWFDTHLKGIPSILRPSAVRLYVMGRDEWCDFDVWPPQVDETYYFMRGKGLYGGGLLTDEMPGVDESADKYSYDPAEPTPNVGGALISADAGARDNRALEGRHDVLVYTTEVLDVPLEIVGRPRVVLYVQSSSEYTDFFGRICVVHPDGRSINICDGLQRLEPGSGERQPDGTLRIILTLSPTAYCFAAW